MPFEIVSDNAEELFIRGMEHFRRGENLKALACFEKSCSISKTPACQSYMGMCIALERGKVSEGLALCEEALRQEPEKSELYLNFGKVLLKAGRRAEAIDVVRKGLAFGHYDDAVSLLERLGIRRKPAFSFLSRGHFLNKYTGLLLHKMGFKGPRS